MEGEEKERISSNSDAVRQEVILVEHNLENWQSHSKVRYNPNSAGETTEWSYSGGDLSSNVPNPLQFSQMDFSKSLTLILLYCSQFFILLSLISKFTRVFNIRTKLSSLYELFVVSSLFLVLINCIMFTLTFTPFEDNDLQEEVNEADINQDDNYGDLCNVSYTGFGAWVSIEIVCEDSSAGIVTSPGLGFWLYLCTIFPLLFALVFKK
ncbi:MAG: hypothetical protein CMB21_05200 [Euryarchaeota archaeon]|nr:hypothetical protein [Euryarchaeota archaeon]